MKKLLIFILPVFFLACTSSEETKDIYTGESVSYSLFSGSDVGSAGEVEFKERTDGSVDVIITLDQYNGRESFPVHLHYGDLSNPDAPQATLLSNFSGEKGQSITNVKTLADESLFTIERARNFDGSIKIHLGDTGPDYDVIISAGNIGSNESKGFNLQGIAVCGEDIESL